MKKIYILFVFCFILLVILSFGCDTRDKYKKEVESKGITYSRENFLKEVMAGNKENVELFIKAGININDKLENGMTALMLSADSGHFEIAKLLIDRDIDINAKDNALGWTALMHTAGSGNVEIAKLLIEKGADINAKDNTGSNMLVIFTVANKTQLVKLILDNEFNVNAKDETGKTALFYAAFSKNNDVLKLLIKKANIDEKDNIGDTALKFAIVSDNIEAIELLLEDGADINIKNIKGYTALDAAKVLGKTSIVNLLLKTKGKKIQ